MSQTNRIRVNAILRQALTTGLAAMDGTAGTLSGTGALSETETLSGTGARPGTSALGGAGAISSGGALTASEQRTVLAEAARTALVQAGWTVTLVDAADPGGYAGLEATRGTEHLLAAIADDDLITDQSGAHDCAATVDVLVAGLRAAGAEVTITDSVPHDGLGGSLYAAAGGPTPAHAIAATLRRQRSQGMPARGRHHKTADQLRITGGN